MVRPRRAGERPADQLLPLAEARRPGKVDVDRLEGDGGERDLAGANPVAVDLNQRRRPAPGLAGVPALRDAGHHRERRLGASLEALVDMAERPVVVAVAEQVRLRAGRIGIVPDGAAERGVHQPDIDDPRLRRRVARQEARRDVPALEAEPVDRRVADPAGRLRRIEQDHALFHRPVARVVEQGVMVAADHHRRDAGARQAA